jgi:hypothetical protein
VVTSAADLTELLLSYIIIMSNDGEDIEKSFHFLKGARYAFEIYYSLLCKVNDAEI